MRIQTNPEAGAPSGLSPVRTTARQEQGFALVVALMVLLVLSLVGIALMTSVNISTKSAGHVARQSEALGLAEAGVAEAVARIQSKDVPDTLNPRMVTQIFNVAAGSVPILGTDSTALATQQPAGKWLDYSNATRGSSVLTVTYKTNTARTQIYRYDNKSAPTVQFTTGNPIFVVSAVGRVGTARSHVVTEVVRTTGTAMVRGAVTANYNYKTTGACMVCGYNHRADTPWDQSDTETRGQAGSCFESPTQWETGDGNLPGIWSSGTITYTNPQNVWYGEPAAIQPNQTTPFYAGPWEALGMSESEFWTWLGPRTNTLPAAPTGVVYIDNDNIHQNRAGSWNISHNGTYGTGFFYVDGSLSVSGSLHYKGLIYTENYCKMTNDSWILGAIIARGGLGTVQDGLTNTTRVLYSGEAISQYVGVSASGSSFVTLSWREVDD
ncbi:MAG TPA: PilX N-terminal domain-containing pilus assembly protein [Candidatus Eisenbacteria bacterium]|jgi:Tfp pilus assembly protein PilX